MFSPLLAKYWYLNYGDVKHADLILRGLDYGLSIAELKAYDKLPEIECGFLALCGLKLNDITGLEIFQVLNQLLDFIFKTMSLLI